MGFCDLITFTCAKTACSQSSKLKLKLKFADRWGLALGRALPGARADSPSARLQRPTLLWRPSGRPLRPAAVQPRGRRGRSSCGQAWGWGVRHPRHAMPRVWTTAPPAMWTCSCGSPAMLRGPSRCRRPISKRSELRRRAPRHPLALSTQFRLSKALRLSVQLRHRANRHSAQRGFVLRPVVHLVAQRSGAEALCHS